LLSIVTDTLTMARDVSPGKRNSLDALCERYQIDRSARTLHGALLDSQLLAEVYLAMTRGQESLIAEEETLQITLSPVKVTRDGLVLVVLSPTPEELVTHHEHIAELTRASGSVCIWGIFSTNFRPLPRWRPSLSWITSSTPRFLVDGPGISAKISAR